MPESIGAERPSRIGPVRPAPENASAGGAKRLDPHLVSLSAPASFEAEQYRTLRARLESRQEGKAIQVVAVTSATVGDGKTTTAINLAGALAQSSEARVLLVDADLRRPSVESLLGWSGPGLADAILDTDRTLMSTVRQDPSMNLSVITAGRRPEAPYEALKSARLGTLFEEMRRHYDYIVVDTPPLLPVPDCRLIARWVDGFLMVVAAHRTPRKLFEEGMSLLDPSRVIGLVFNGASRPYSRYYGRYHAYGHPSRQSAPGPRPPSRPAPRPTSG
jgi:capsular exopolysaccharide synthesis family protein